jgi:hypothetical protein
MQKIMNHRTPVAAAEHQPLPDYHPDVLQPISKPKEKRSEACTSLHSIIQT